MDFGPHLVFAILEGLLQAAVLSLTAVGLSLVFGVMRVVNVAHGEFFMLGAVVTWFVASLIGASPSVSFLIALVVAPLLVGLLAAAADWLVLKRLDYDPEATIVATIGLLYILQQGTLMTFGPDARPVEPPFNSRIALPWPEWGADGFAWVYPWGFGTTSYKLFVIAAAIVLLLAVWLFMTRSRAGLILRATQMDRDMATAFGIPVERVYAGHFRDRRGPRRPRRSAHRSHLAGPLPDGCGSAFALLHRRDHRRARLAQRHRHRRADHRPVRRGHLRLLHTNPRQNSRHAPCCAGSRLPTHRPVRDPQRMSRGLILAVGILAALLALHFILPAYHHGQVARIMVLAVYAMGYNILFGYTGLLSLGHAMFFAAGLYGFGLAVQLGDLPFLPAFAIALIAAALLGLIAGALALRTEGVAFMIVTLMFAQAGYLTILYFGDYTRADEGFVLAAHGRQFLGLDFSQADPRYLAALALFSVALLAKLALGHKRHWAYSCGHPREPRTRPHARL